MPPVPVTRAAILALLLTAAAPEAPMGPPGSDDVTIAGLGTVPCDAFIDRTSSVADLDKTRQWILGFLSGIAVEGDRDDPLARMPTRSVWLWIDAYCRDHHDEDVLDAAEAFVRSQRPHP